MRFRAKYIGLSIVCILLITGFSTPLYSNLWGVLTGNGFTIPEESSVFTFRVTQMNEGSGEYWLYGMDKNYYYSQMRSDEKKTYIKISKEKAKEIESFDKTNFKTWDYEYLCGDLLEIYAQKPEGLEFVGCQKVDHAQTVVVATYRVSGEKSREVENFLVENYGMGNLKWACCGWDTAGKYGSLDHEELTRVDRFLCGMIQMFASGEVTDENEPSRIRLETDRDKIDYFFVEVKLAII